MGNLDSAVKQELSCTFYRGHFGFLRGPVLSSSSTTFDEVFPEGTIALLSWVIRVFRFPDD